MALPALGETLAGKYRIDRVIGEGGMGVVFEAFHLKLQQRVAIKMLRPDVLGNRTVTGRFEREARAAARLQGPNVAKVLDVDAADGHPYLVIEFLDGHDLAIELEQRGKLPIPEAVGYVLEACIPIAQAHGQGIIHRDLKPSNLFLANVDGKRVLKLLDFGISKFIAEGSKLTAGAEALGTPEYMSPEQIRQTANVDHRADIWSLGVILYELLTGTVPFEGVASAIIAAVMVDTIVPVRAVRREVPDLLEAIVMRSLEKAPEKRFQSVVELAAALEPFASAQLGKGTLESLPPPKPLAEMLEPEPEAGVPSRRTMRSWESMPPPSTKRGKSSSWLLAAAIMVASGTAGWIYWKVRPHHVVAAQAAVAPPPVVTAAVAAVADPRPTASAVEPLAVVGSASPGASASAGAKGHPLHHLGHTGTGTGTVTGTATATATATAKSPTNMFDQRF